MRDSPSKQHVSVEDWRPGFYKTRLVRDGPWVPVKVWDEAKRHPRTGELLEDERLKALRNNEPIDPKRLGMPVYKRITKAEYEHMVAQVEWSRGSDDPKSTPTQPVNFAKVGHNRPPGDTDIEQAEKLIEDATPLNQGPISALDDAEAATFLIKQINVVVGRLDAQRKKAKAPHAAAMAEAEQPYRKAIEALTTAKRGLNGRLHRFRLDANASKPVETDYGAKAFTSTRQVVEITDLAKVPREYMVPDMAAIGKALRAKKTVAGAMLKTITSTVVS